VILKIITEFHEDNERNITEGLSPLDHKDLDKRLTLAGITLPTNQVKELTGICKNI